MSDNGEEVEVESPNEGYPVLPKDVVAEIGSVKLFNKWSYEDVEIRGTEPAMPSNLPR
jgi:small subunit ribosomal protein S5e